MDSKMMNRASMNTGQNLYYSAAQSAPSVRRDSSKEFRKLYSLSLSHLTSHSDFQDFHIKPTPYYIRWVHGYNQKAGIINLNDKGSTTIFYAACNFGILYNWTTNQMRILQGHRHLVTCIAADAAGRWLATGDTGSENVIIMWDNKDVFPYRTIFNPHRNTKLARLALSHDAKYLLTLGYGHKAQVFWWIWSVPLNEPHAQIEIGINKESCLDMQFNPTNSLQFALLTKDELWIGVAAKIFVNERGVIKETADYELKMRNPEKKTSLDMGRHVTFCFVGPTSQILVSTSRGAVLIYGYSMEYSTEADSSKIEKLKYVKALKIENHRINVIKYVDGIVVTGNKGGEIHFYDDQLKRLYWVHGFQVDNVRGLSFNISPRSSMILDPKCNKPCPCWEKVVAEKDPQTGELCTKLIKSKIPTDATKGGLPFVIRDFIVNTLHQGIGFVDFVTEKVQTILDYRLTNARALSVHPEKQLVCVGYMDGTVELLNYQEHKLITRLDLRDTYKIVVEPKDDSINSKFDITIPHLSITCLKYSPSGHHLACGLNTGQLIFLHPSTIDIVSKKPFKDTRFAIQEICYSPDSLTLAFYDAGRTVCVYKYDCVNFHWTFIGKHRAHYKDITSLLFIPRKNSNGEFKLLSFGMDRIMAEYDVGQSSDEYLEVMSLDRVDQTAIPLAGIVWPMPADLDPELTTQYLPLILLANDEHKYKIINYDTSMTLATYLGPRFEHPVKYITLFTQKDDKKPTDPKQGLEQKEPEEKQYLMFATKTIIGIQKMPLDGNPWKHCGMIGHPNQLLATCFLQRNNTLFTIGTKDNCMCQWIANPRAVDKTTAMGGGDLDPYYCLIENGRPGWLFQEIRDLFYYIQILCQGTFSPAMRRVKDYIPIESLPDLMRALGFFPSEYEVENLTVEAKFKVYNRIPTAEIDFEEFVKLYLNHRPAFPETYKKIKSSFKTFAVSSKREGDFMKRADFVKMLTNYGENFSKELSWYLLSILAGHTFEDRAAAVSEEFNFLPAKITLGDITTIMGIPDQDNISEQQSQNASSISGSSDSSNDSDDRWFY